MKDKGRLGAGANLLAEPREAPDHRQEVDKQDQKGPGKQGVKNSLSTLGEKKANSSL